MLHNEVRNLVVDAYEKTHNAQLVGELFGISKWTVYHLAEQKERTGCVDLRTSQRGRKKLLSKEDEKRICDCIEETPDITIEEIRDKLSLSASYSTVERIILAHGYTRKKKSLYATERERPRCERKKKGMGKEDNHKIDTETCIS